LTAQSAVSFFSAFAASFRMANRKHLNILRQGAVAWNEWREANREIKPDLSGADLSGADLTGADLGHANLNRASLTEVNLSGAILSFANLSMADLARANLRVTKLSGADLHDASLYETNFKYAELYGADLTTASMALTNFAGVDLSTVKGLETVKHLGRSTIGIDTIYYSKGQIPVGFLRGAGVPENFIEFMSSLVGTAFEFYSCFISYSGNDEEFAKRLFADLQTEGVRCWFAPHHAQAGKKLHEQIDSAIRIHEKLLLILSPDSINSEWVKTEITTARKREITEGKRVLFPIRLKIPFEKLQEWECFDADRGKDSAREIREYYIPDFSKWKDHDEYQKEFKKLVRDLKK
jgi:uncharacterized protein YjbI with pentapeptide repeats